MSECNFDKITTYVCRSLLSSCVVTMAISSSDLHLFSQHNTATDGLDGPERTANFVRTRE